MPLTNDLTLSRATKSKCSGATSVKTLNPTEMIDMETSLTVKILPSNGSWQEAKALIQSVQTDMTQAGTVDKLNIEVSEIYCDKSKASSINHACNIANQTVNL